MVTNDRNSPSHVRAAPRRLIKALRHIFVCGVVILIPGCGLGTHPRVITPVYPPLGNWVDPTTSTPPQVDSLTPCLRWRPNSSMEEDLTRLLKGTPDSLKYELAIWKTKGFSSEETEASGAKVIHSDSMVERPGPLCYHRTDLINTEHVVETPLEPNTLYLWSVRVKAERGGQAYLTEWATFNSNLNYGIFGLPVETTVVTGAMWRFKTPKVEK